ncbi:MAG: Spo0E family sporulation regulatory protein-aspartic acid phosphatase [Tissierellaceae bacterium]|nr:Spo0E family sporulation regulatory protein-aspartic acid phosphatase [Tissierellaceae bacterium]
MEEKEYLNMLNEKIIRERHNLNNLILNGVEYIDLLKSSCRLDELINEYYRITLHANIPFKASKCS